MVRSALPVQLVKNRADLELIGEVERRRRLVEQEDFGRVVAAIPG